MSTNKPKDRFLSKVLEVNGCWEWQAGIMKKTGYGQFWYEGTNHLAHRISYLFFKGGIPDNLCVCHTCDNRKCVNPEHLWLGTHKENVADCYRKGRHPKTGRPRKTKLEPNASYKAKWYIENRDRLKAEMKTGWSYLNKEITND